MISANEADGGRYDCHLGGSLLCSYNITVDAHRCTPPNKSNDYQKIYSDWCHEFEKYKSAMKSWEKKQAVSKPLLRVLSAFQINKNENTLKYKFYIIMPFMTKFYEFVVFNINDRIMTS